MIRKKVGQRVLPSLFTYIEANMENETLKNILTKMYLFSKRSIFLIQTLKIQGSEEDQNRRSTRANFFFFSEVSKILEKCLVEKSLLIQLRTIFQPTVSLVT